MKTTIDGRLAALPKVSQNLSNPGNIKVAKFTMFKPEDYLEIPGGFAPNGHGYKVTVEGVYADIVQPLQRGYLVRVTGELNEETREIIGERLEVLSRSERGIEGRY